MLKGPVRKNIKVSLVGCIDQACLIKSHFADTAKRPGCSTLSHLNEVTDMDIHNVYDRPLAHGERPYEVDCTSTYDWRQIAFRVGHSQRFNASKI